MAKVSALSDHTGYWLRLVSNAVSHAFARKVAGEQVTVAEWAFMRALHGGEGVAPSVLAGDMGMTRGAISKLADRLEAKGLVARTDNARDRRAHSLALTDAGRALVPRLAALADRNDAEFFGVLSREERHALERALAALVERRGLKGVPVD
ncbi:MarR family transcriptional regulator [uncultured Alsobacter sp.]|uniref:MarR family winged helix-turn-helix transcriptional regulator n=1 Tax=uncultured Alsobacter sp. TaxID=1748258 RepID=UPI0025D3DBFA|nr:MarR family transcriptional regulator [uncultured Alsobacter sp.]